MPSTPLRVISGNVSDLAAASAARTPANLRIKILTEQLAKHRGACHFALARLGVAPVTPLANCHRDYPKLAGRERAPAKLCA